MNNVMKKPMRFKTESKATVGEIDEFEKACSARSTFIIQRLNVTPSLIANEFNMTLSMEELIPLKPTGAESEPESCEDWAVGERCVYDHEAAIVVGWHPEHPVIVIDSCKHGFTAVQVGQISKPETPERKAAREAVEKENIDALVTLIKVECTPTPLVTL